MPFRNPFVALSVFINLASHHETSSLNYQIQ